MVWCRFMVNLIPKQGFNLVFESFWSSSNDLEQRCSSSSAAQTCWDPPWFTQRNLQACSNKLMDQCFACHISSRRGWLLPLEFSLLAALCCRHTSTLTPSGSNPFFPVWDQRSAACLLLLSIQIHFEGWSLLSMNIHSAFLKTPDFWKVSEKKSKVKNIFKKKQTPHEWEKRFCNLNP